MTERPLVHAPLALAVTAAMALTAPGSAAAAPASSTSPAATAAPAASDARVGLDERQDLTLPLEVPRAVAPAQPRAAAAPVVGETRDWPALDTGGVTGAGQSEEGGLYLKPFTLRGVGDGIEVWVAGDLAFPAGDCRNTVGGGEAVTVTDDQVADLVEQFDATILPAESAAFSVAPARDGSERPPVPDLDAAYPADQWAGPGGRTVVLVDNVRDQNFRDPTSPDGKTYTAGFFSPGFTDLLDRNTMVVDGFDWVHRTGEDPPDDAAEPDYAACVAAIGGPVFGDPRPTLYESTFAHEYQHLLESYEDPDELVWPNEGLSDWAQSLTGYVDPSVPPSEEGADSHLRSFLGFRPGFGGPEQSLTSWEDQGAPEILADYGVAYAFMEHLHSRFGGDAFMAALHAEDADGLAGLDAVLDRSGHAEGSQEVLHDFLASMAVDRVLDRGAQVVTGKGGAQLQTSSMSAEVAWDSEDAYGTPGAPTNGADYVRLRGDGGYVSDGGISFSGATAYPTTPVEWQPDGARLASGSGDGLDRGIVRELAIPQDAPTMTVDLDVQAQEGWDFAVVQVWDAGTGTWRSLANAATSDRAAEGADPRVVASLPGFTGTVAGPQTFDMSAYAGQSVEVAVRYVTDGSVSEAGARIDALSMGGVDVAGATDPAGWRSLSEARPTPVAGWTVQLVGYDDQRVAVVEVPLEATPEGWTWSGDVSDVLGMTPDVAAALVTADDPGEQVRQYAPYALTVDGALQPGGGGR